MKDKLKNIKKEHIIILEVGFLLGVLLMLILYPERIAKLENGEYAAATVAESNITADEIYNGLKDKYASNVLLDLIDEAILNKKYKELTKDEQEEVATSVDSYIKQYAEYYSKTEDEVLETLGFENKEDFTKYMELDYKRNKYFKEYVANTLTDEEIEDYYKNNVFADSEVEHILVEVSSERTETEAEDLAKEILNKLKNGTSWDDLKNEYKDDITTESFNISFDSNIEKPFLNGVYGLEEGGYSKQLVRTSYGYHIIYRKKITEEKPELKEIKTRIINVLINNKRNEDSKLYEKVMIEMRKEAKLKIKDTELKSQYDKYADNYKD